jgi:hypothetical protein
MLPIRGLSSFYYISAGLIMMCFNFQQQQALTLAIKIKNMFHLKTLLILVITFVILTYLSKRLKEQSTVLTSAVMFVLPILLFIGLLQTFYSLTEYETLTSFTGVDSLISFNILSIKIRNSAMIVGLATISYGLYDQNRLRKNRLVLYSSYLLGGMTLILIIMLIMAGGFII